MTLAARFRSSLAPLGRTRLALRSAAPVAAAVSPVIVPRAVLLCRSIQEEGKRGWDARLGGLLGRSSGVSGGARGGSGGAGGGGGGGSTGTGSDKSAGQQGSTIVQLLGFLATVVAVTVHVCASGFRVQPAAAGDD